MPHPDVNGRKDIFDLYLDKINIVEGVDSAKLAKMCPGFTGAEIQNLVNNAIADAVHDERTAATMKDFELA